MFKFQPLNKKPYSSKELQEYRFTDNSMLGVYLDMLDCYISSYNKSQEYNELIALDLTTIREYCDYAYNDNTQADNVLVTMAKIKSETNQDIIKNQCKIAIFALMSIN